MDYSFTTIGALIGMAVAIILIIKKVQPAYSLILGALITIILLLQHGKVRLDHDLLENTEEGYETIVKMGERIGETRKRQHGAVSADVSQ